MKKLCVLFIILAVVLGGMPTARAAGHTIRVATYNIEWFGTKPSTPNRIQRLKSVIEKLDADIMTPPKKAQAASA